MLDSRRDSRRTPLYPLGREEKVSNREVIGVGERVNEDILHAVRVAAARRKRDADDIVRAAAARVDEVHGQFSGKIGDLQNRNRNKTIAISILVILAIGLLIGMVIFIVKSQIEEEDAVVPEEPSEELKRENARLSETNRKLKTDVKQMFVLGWDPDSAAGKAYTDLREKIGEDPTYWTRGRGGVARWDGCALDSLKESEDTEKKAMSHLSSLAITERSEENGEFVITTSILYEISDRNLPFILALDRRLDYDGAYQQLSASGNNFSEAVTMLKSAIMISEGTQTLQQAVSPSNPESYLSSIAGAPDWNSDLRAKRIKEFLDYITEIKVNKKTSGLTSSESRALKKLPCRTLPLRRNFVKSE